MDKDKAVVKFVFFMSLVAALIGVSAFGLWFVFSTWG